MEINYKRFNMSSFSVKIIKYMNYKFAFSVIAADHGRKPKEILSHEVELHVQPVCNNDDITRITKERMVEILTAHHTNNLVNQYHI